MRVWIGKSLSRVLYQFHLDCVRRFLHELGFFISDQCWLCVWNCYFIKYYFRDHSRYFYGLFSM